MILWFLMPKEVDQYVLFDMGNPEYRSRAIVFVSTMQCRMHPQYSPTERLQQEYHTSSLFLHDGNDNDALL